jgi:hypothetical protein
MSWWVDTHRKDGYWWWWRRVTSAFAWTASTSIRRVPWFRQSNLNLMEVLFLTNIIRRVPAHTAQQKHQTSFTPTSESWRNVNRCQPTREICIITACNTSTWGVHIIRDDEARSLVVLCATQTEKRINYSTTSERSNLI